MRARLLTLAVLGVLAAPAAPAGAAVSLTAPRIGVEPGLAGSSVAVVALGAGPNVGKVTLAVGAVTPGASPSWAVIAPGAGTGPVSPPVNVPFTVVVNVPFSAKGDIAFELIARADATEVGRVTLTVATGVPGGGGGLLSKPSFNVTWKASQARGTLVVRGTATSAGKVHVELKLGKSSRGLNGTVKKGKFTARLKLPATIVPGAYRATVTSPGAQGTFPLTLAGPPEGVVDKAFLSATACGLKATFLPPNQRAFVCFHFAARPRSAEVIVTFRRSGVKPASVGKTVDRKGNVSAFVVPEQRGSWRVEAKVRGRLVKAFSFTIR